MVRNRAHLFAVLFLILAFVVGPPFSFAARLPLACKPFLPDKKIEAGPCSIKALSPQDHSGDLRVAVPEKMDLESISPSGVSEKPIQVLFLIKFDSLPLRC